MDPITIYETERKQMIAAISESLAALKKCKVRDSHSAIVELRKTLRTLKA